MTDASQVGKAFNLVVTLTAPDVIMDSLTASLGITVQAAPAVASDTPSWQNILLYGLPAGIAMTLIAALAIHRYKQAQEKAKEDKTDAAVKEAKDNLDDATGGDPKKTVKDVVAANKEVLPTVQDNIQKNQTLILQP